jgi:hypothetical protein
MPEKEKDLLNCFRQLPPEDQAAVLSHVRTAQIAENSIRKILTPVPSADCSNNGGLYNEEESS